MGLLSQSTTHSRFLTYSPTLSSSLLPFLKMNDPVTLMGKFRLVASKLWSQQLNTSAFPKDIFFAISWNELSIKFFPHQDSIHLIFFILYLFQPIHLFPTPTPHITSTLSHIFCLSEGAHWTGHYGSSCRKHNSPQGKGRSLNRRGDWLCSRWWERNDIMFLSVLAMNLYICGYIIFTNTVKGLSE